MVKVYNNAKNKRSWLPLGSMFPMMVSAVLAVPLVVFIISKTQDGGIDFYTAAAGAGTSGSDSGSGGSNSVRSLQSRKSLEQQQRLMSSSHGSGGDRGSRTRSFMMMMKGPKRRHVGGRH